MRSFTTSFLLFTATSCAVLAAPSSKPACPWTATLECKVEGEDSPEAALRQVDEHALRSMYCHLGCDFVVNHALPHAFSTYIRPTCSVHKDENHIEYKKFKSKDDKDEKGVKTRRSVGSKTSEPGQQVEKRDIDAYTVGSATFRFCCTDPHGKDYSEAAAKRIGLELSICKKLS